MICMKWKGVEPNKVTTQYCYDGVLSSTPIEDLKNKHPVYSATKDLANKSAVITISTFSNLEGYLEFGDEHVYRFREVEEFRRRILEYATANNLLEIEDPTQIPQSYWEFETALRGEIFGSQKKKRFLVRFWDDVVSGGTGNASVNLNMPAGYVVLGNWNNKFGGCYGVNIAHVVHGYDRTFYRSKLGSYAAWGMTFYSYAAFGFQQLDNRISSLLLM